MATIEAAGADLVRVLLIVDCYLPSTKSSAKLVSDLAIELRDGGHDVTVLAPDEHIAEPLSVMVEDGIVVVRARSGQIKGASRAVRGLREAILSDLLWSRSRAYFERHAHDVVVFYSPTIFFGRLVLRLKRLWRCKAYLILRDLFPQWALDAGVLRRGPAYYFFKLVEQIQYRAADVIGVQSPANLTYFVARRIAPGRVEVLYNWARAEKATVPVSLPEAVRGKLVFFFGGNMGVAQDMDAVLRLASALRDRSDVAFLLVGDGSEVPRIAEHIAKRELKNVHLMPPLDQRTYRSLLEQVHVGLITLNGRLTTQNIPGKLLGYLDAGIPVLCSVNADNDLLPILREAHAGLGCTAGDDNRFLELARTLIEAPTLRDELGRNGRRLLATRFSAAAVARQILSHFEVLDRRSSADDVIAAELGR